MKNILVVDDDKLVRNIVSGLLTKEGYEVTLAENGLDGLAKLAKFTPDLIISDVLMPGMDGYEFCTKVRGLPETRHLPLLMLTSLDSVEQRIKGFDVGADDYIVKPFEPREFLARVISLLKRSDHFQAIQHEEKASGKTIAVFSLRGGAGVSTIATNVAVGLSQIWGKPTTLVDMVMVGGQSALFLNQSLKHTWTEIVQAQAQEIDDYLVQAVLLPHDSGVFTLASPKHPEMSELITPEKVTRVLSILKDSNDYIVLDLPHNFDATTLIGLDMSDVILLVLQPEIASVRSARIALQTFTELGYNPDQICLILNMTFPRKGISAAAIEKALDKEISLTIPCAITEMLKGLNFGTPPTYTAPEEALGLLFEDFSLTLSKEKHREKEPTTPSEAWLRVSKRHTKPKTKK